MITNTGKNLVVRYLAGVAPTFAGEIAVGVGFTENDTNTNTLDFEIARYEIVGGAMLGTENKVVYQTTVTDAQDYIIGEIGLYPSVTRTTITSYRTNLVSYFEPDSGLTLSNAAFVSRDTAGQSSKIRIGKQAIELTTTNSMVTVPIKEQYSQFSALDKIKLAMVGHDTSGSFNIELKIYDNSSTTPMSIILDSTDTANVTIKSDTVTPYKYIIASKLIGTQTVDFSSILKIEVINKSSNPVIIDGLKFEEIDGLSPFNSLVSRQKLSTLKTKSIGSPMDIEYQFGIAFG
jgi:hypothetical protein